MNKPQDTSLPVKIQLVDSFWHFGPAFQRWAESQTQRDGLSAQRLRILVLLQEQGAMIMRELTGLLGVSPTNVTALIDALEKDDLVCRQPHPSDRRATLIAITPKAQATLSASCMAYRERIARLFEHLSDAESLQLLETLAKLRTELGEIGRD